MEVILLKKVGNLGGLGEKVAVRPGYGRNFLIPQGYAVPATEANLTAFEEQRAELEREAEEAVVGAEARRGQLDGTTVTIVRRAGEEGRLFGSVGAGDIVSALQDQGIELEKQEVRLPEGPLRVAGEHEVALHLHADVDVTIKIEIVPEK